MKVLSIIENAYRGTLEEQDDTVVWITHTMKRGGGDFNVLLRGNAVNYGARGQDASGLSFGSWKQTEPPRLDHDLTALIGAGVDAYYVSEDAVDRGLKSECMIDGLKPIGRDKIADLLASHDQVWNW